MILSLAISGVALVVVLAALRLWRYSRWFRVPARRTDQFTCSGDQLAIPLALAADGFDLPDGLNLAGRTVFLHLLVESSLMARLFDPFIEIQNATLTHRQYFERGAGGARYLNLSPFFQVSSNAVTRLHLSGHRMSWKAQASLLAFESPAIEGAGVLVLAPHPDDAEIAAFGLYANRQSWIVTVTAGEKGTGNLPPHIPRADRPRWAALLRVIDSLTIPKLGRVATQRCVNLVMPDGALEPMHRNPSDRFQLACEQDLSRSQLRAANQLEAFRGGTSSCSWNELVDELRQLLDLTQPDVIVCPHPLLDSHPDHIYSTVALAQALRGIAGKQPLFLLYAVHLAQLPSYPAGPAHSLMSLPPGRHDQPIGDAIYSHPLDPDLQQTKQFAVEAMHAVRRFGVEGGTSNFRAILKGMQQQIFAFLSGMSVDPASFLRRAPRPNEIYYVAQAATLNELIQRLTQ